MTIPELRIVPPPPDGLASAFRQAAARRRRKAAATGSAGLVGAAVVFATLTGGTGQVLTQEDPLPPADQRELPLLPVGPTAAPAQPPVHTTTTRDGRSTTVAAGPRGSSPVTDSTTEAEQVGSRPVTAPRRPAPPAYRVGPMSRTAVTAIPALSSCTMVGGLCSAVYGPGSGSNPTLTVELCNSDAEAVRIDFAALDELDIAVSQAGRVVWRWASGRPRVADPHQVRLSSSACLIWTTPWASVDQSGRALPPGSYVATSTIDSPDAADAAQAQRSFTVEER